MLITTLSGFAFAAGVVLTIALIRSILVIGFAFWVSLGTRFGKERRIYHVAYRDKQLMQEAKAGLLVLLFDATVIGASSQLGWLNPAPFHWLNALVTFVAVFCWIEIWFYVTHRLMHTKPLYWLHRQHHTAVITNPLTSLSFSLGERAVLLFGVLGVFLPLSNVLPVSQVGLIGYFSINYILNVAGHSNVEFFPPNWDRRWLGRALITPTYHSMHHARYRGHYGLFTQFLDRWFGTRFEDYEHAQTRAATGKPLTRPGERATGYEA